MVRRAVLNNGPLSEGCFRGDVLDLTTGEVWPAMVYRSWDGLRYSSQITIDRPVNQRINGKHSQIRRSGRLEGCSFHDKTLIVLERRSCHGCGCFLLTIEARRWSDFALKWDEVDEL